MCASGKVVSGYRIRNGQWTLIGRQSPQLPQVLLNVHVVSCSTSLILITFPLEIFQPNFGSVVYVRSS